MNAEPVFEILALVERPLEDSIRSALGGLEGCSMRMDSGADALDPDILPEHVNLVLLDPDAVPVPAVDGISLIKAACTTCEIVLLLDDTDIIMDVELMKIGAYGSLPKPPSSDDLRKLIYGLMEKNEIERENRALVEALGESRAQTIISHSPEMEKVLSMAARAARSESTVLLSGESGTGKELVARAIHLFGPRKSKPFVPVNIAALPENLIESELFGHVRGSFTGAMNDRTGRFALADGGTLFIDEIGEVPPGIQVKLLRVLQFGSYERVGENTPREANVRIIAATNRDLEAEVRQGRFRADLYYRVNVVPVSIPPLREHRSDITYLAEFFMKKYAHKNQKKVTGITAEAMSRVMRYRFPGNVRELENIIERGVVLCRGEYLTETDIFLPVDSLEPVPEGSAAAVNYDVAMSDFERAIMKRSLERNGGNKSAAARDLGINERRLRYRLKVLGLE